MIRQCMLSEHNSAKPHQFGSPLDLSQAAYNPHDPDRCLAFVRVPAAHIPGHDNLPSNLSSPEERQAAADPGIPAAALEKPMETSPTGEPIINPQSNVAKVVIGLLFAAASAVAIKQPDLFTNTEIDQQVAVIVLSLLGLLSPGLRRSA
jgi:hypothetical protein